MSAQIRSVFVTGTDTGVGKTWASVALLHALRARGIDAIGMKPVASGCQWQAGRWVNDDARCLQAHSSVALDYAALNPYAFAPAISPHIAARQAGVCIDLERIASAYAALAALAPAVIVEGVGGWLAPLSDDLSVEDLARRLNLPVVLVVGLRLGCLNHAQLSARAIRATGLNLAGWIANRPQAPMDAEADNLATLQRRLDAPCLGILPYSTTAQPDAAWLAQASAALSL